MEVTRRIHTDYLHGALDHDRRVELVDRGLAILRAWDLPFEAVAVRGFSGATVGAILAHALGKALIIVRKEGDTTHSAERVEGALDWEPRARYLIIDDFVSSGNTVRAIREAIGRKAEYVGTYQWQRECFYETGPADRGWTCQREQEERMAASKAVRDEMKTVKFRGLTLGDYAFYQELQFEKLKGLQP